MVRPTVFCKVTGTGMSWDARVLSREPTAKERRKLVQPVLLRQAGGTGIGCYLPGEKNDFSDSHQAVSTQKSDLSLHNSIIWLRSTLRVLGTDSYTPAQPISKIILEDNTQDSTSETSSANGFYTK